jgi:hypothetical protein
MIFTDLLLITSGINFIKTKKILDILFSPTIIIKSFGLFRSGREARVNS